MRFTSTTSWGGVTEQLFTLDEIPACCGRRLADLYKAIHAGDVDKHLLSLVRLRTSQINGCTTWSRGA